MVFCSDSIQKFPFFISDVFLQKMPSAVVVRAVWMLKMHLYNGGKTKVYMQRIEFSFAQMPSDSICIKWHFNRDGSSSLNKVYYNPDY